MKYVDEFRDPARAKALTEALARETRGPWVIMEVCGGQTHAILRFGIDTLLPPGLELVHGPGCPVCVTPLEMLDKARALADRVVLATYGDMIRILGVPARPVYSPLDALRLAKESGREVVFFAPGFETTAPMTATAIERARSERVANFSVLVAHLRMPPVMAALLQAPDNRVQAYLGPGHVATITGLREYDALARRFRVPIVVTGFEPIDLLEGVLLAVRQLEAGRADVENQYARSVRPSGNDEALATLDRVFDVVDRNWRGIGAVPKSGYRVRAEYAEHDAERRYDLEGPGTPEPRDCVSGLVLKGLKKPTECPEFGRKCTPEHPLGATMVSSEGACAAYYAYARRHPA